MAYSDSKLYPTSDNVANWVSVIDALNTFCSQTRKDCIAIVDSPRNFSLVSNLSHLKVNPSHTISNTIVPNMRYLSSVNSTNLALYSNWLNIPNSYSSIYSTWMPPSVKAVGVICKTDSTYGYWNAPAGLRTGVVNNINEMSFHPDNIEEDLIYKNSLNYFKKINNNYYLHTQKLHVSKNSVLNKINTKRTVLKIQRFVRKMLNYYNFENNTDMTRKQVISLIKPVLDGLKTKTIINDYHLICDETNNTDAVIDNNELIVTLMVQPINSIEYIIIDVIAETISK